MPLGLWNIEWINQNSQRRFPLTQDSSAQDTTGSFTLPNDFFLELDLPVHQGLNVDPSRFFIQSMGIYSTGFVIGLGYTPAVGSPVSVATAFIARSTHVYGNTYTLGGINDYADTVGKIVVGNLASIDQQPAGQFNFDLTGARIDPECVRPILRCLSSISVSNGVEVSEAMYGDIILVAEQNMQIVPIIVTGQDSELRFSAIQGEGLADPCVCQGSNVGPPIRRINGIPPTAAGDFTILGNTCLEVDGIQNGIKLNDICSQPCCGCQELEVVTQALEQFGAEATTLQNTLNRLEASVTEMDLVVLGSKLNDQGCVQCS